MQSDFCGGNGVMTVSWSAGQGRPQWLKEDVTEQLQIEVVIAHARSVQTDARVHLVRCTDCDNADATNTV